MLRARNPLGLYVLQGDKESCVPAIGTIFLPSSFILYVSFALLVLISNDRATQEGSNHFSLKKWLVCRLHRNHNFALIL